MSNIINFPITEQRCCVYPICMCEQIKAEQNLNADRKHRLMEILEGMLAIRKELKERPKLAG